MSATYERFLTPIFVMLIASLLLSVDDLLVVDGVETTCAESSLDCATWFCPTCPFSGTCDAHCGYCQVDCDGRCWTPDECRVDALGYETCEPWIGNGCCDDGLGYPSDTGARPRFNCEAFGCDGGDCDCEPTALEPTQADWCVLLTATVCPARDMTHTTRRDPVLRRSDYDAALAQWADGQMPVIFVENSAANLTAWRKGRNADFISFRDAQVRPELGKGQAEYRSILHAMAHATINCSMLVKVTGRYFIHDLDRVVAALPPADLVVQSTPSPWTLWDGVLRSEVVAFRNDPNLVHRLFAGQDERIGVPMERTLFLAERDLRAAGLAVARFPSLTVTPTPNAEQSQLVVEL